jgi:hypothetical protein
MSCFKVTGRFNPVHLRHDEIHQREMWRVEMKCRQCMMPVKRFPNHDPFGALLQCRPESGSCRRTVINYKDTDQANSSRCRSLRVTTRASIGMSLSRWTPYPRDLTIPSIRWYGMRTVRIPLLGFKPSAVQQSVCCSGVPSWSLRPSPTPESEQLSHETVKLCATAQRLVRIGSWNRN